jgi:hypothetical protein
MRYSLLIASTLIVATPPVHKIGIAAWCTVNRTDGSIQCNYDTQADCEGYRASDELCQVNPDYKASK